MTQHIRDQGRIFVRRISLTKTVLWVHREGIQVQNLINTKSGERGLKGTLKSSVRDRWSHASSLQLIKINEKKKKKDRWTEPKKNNNNKIDGVLAALIGLE